MVCLVCYVPVVILVVFQWLMNLWNKYRASKRVEAQNGEKGTSGQAAGEGAGKKDDATPSREVQAHLKSGKSE